MVFVDNAPDKFLYKCSVRVFLKGINDTRDQSYNLGSEYELSEEEVVSQVTQDVLDNSTSNTSGSYGQVVAVLDVIILSVVIRRDI